MYNDKRGISQIVTTILIILLVLAAIVIVWQAVKGTITEGSKTIEAQAGCIGLDITIGEAACATTANTISIPITRGGDSVKGAALTVTATDADGNSKTATKTLSALGAVTVTKADFTGLTIGTTVVVNTGITLAGETTMCTGATKTITCSA